MLTTSSAFDLRASQATNRSYSPKPPSPTSRADHKTTMAQLRPSIENGFHSHSVTSTLPAAAITTSSAGRAVSADPAPTYMHLPIVGAVTTTTLIKLGACILLCIQNSALILSQRYSLMVMKEQYVNSTLILSMECCKLLTCVFIITRMEKRSMSFLYHLIITSTKMSVPGIVYVIQNGLQLLALTYLDASVYSIMAQMKILTTALFAGLMLGQYQSSRRWRALLLLVVGAILVQYKPPKISTTTGAATSSTMSANEFTGLLAVLGGTCTSGFAGIYLEKYLKTADLTLWQRNFQLSFWGVIFATGSLWLDRERVMQNGIFGGYSMFTWMLVGMSAFGGLLVAVVVKYTSTVVKGFATSFSIILTSVLSIYLFGSSLDTLFLLGSTCVLLAIFNYSDTGDNTSSVVSKPVSTASKEVYAASDKIGGSDIPLMSVAVRQSS